ncbi:hypothetical protein BHE74_00033964 [Ensete ventricosum]|nr:hypothetical protein BHE74_00033964 [Ensete ventricosum]
MSARRVLVPASRNILYGLTSWRRVASRSASSFPHPCVDTARSNEENADINWDDLGFGLVPTDYMYVMRCSRDDNFSSGVLTRYGNIELSPSAGVLNYGQGLFEGLKAYRKQDGGGFLLFRPEENARRMQMGAERMCMPSLSVEQFIHAVKETVLANKRWVPPQGKGSLYIRPLLIGIGPVLGLAPAPDYMFLIYAAPVGTYFKEGLAPINLVIDDKIPRATPGGTGDVKTITNYAPVHFIASHLILSFSSIMRSQSRFVTVARFCVVHGESARHGSACVRRIIRARSGDLGRLDRDAGLWLAAASRVEESTGLASGHSRVL